MAMEAVSTRTEKLRLWGHLDTELWFSSSADQFGRDTIYIQMVSDWCLMS